MRYKYQSVMKDGNGKIISGGTITVYLTGTSTLASVYTASSGGTAVNSVTSDTEGYFYFWVDDSDYTSWNKFKVVCSKAGFNSKTYGDIRILPETTEISAYSFGAAGDGVTDDTTALNAAFATGKRVNLLNGSYKISSSLFIPAYGQLTGTTYATITASAGTYTGNYMILYNSTDGSTWVSSYIDNRTGNCIENLILTGLDDLSLSGIFFAGRASIENIRSNYMKSTIVSSENYNDGVYISSISTDTNCDPDNYQIILNQLGDSLNISRIGINTEGKGIYINGCFGGNLVDAVCNGEIKIENSGAITIKNLHSETYSHVYILDSDCSIEDSIIYSNAGDTYTPIEASVSGDDRYTLALKNVAIARYTDQEYTDFHDLKINSKYNVTIDSCYRKVIERGVIERSQLAGLYIKDGDDTDIDDFNDFSYALSHRSIVKQNSVVDKMLSSILRTGTPYIINPAYSDTSDVIEWKESTGTYYYQCVVLSDPNRLTGSTNSWGEASEAVTNGGEGVYLKLSSGNVNPNSILRLYRGTSTGSYTAYVDIHTINTTLLYDDGDNCNHIEWIARSAAGVDTINTVYEYSVTGTRAVVTMAAAPTVGTWKNGDRVWKTTVAASASPGWICTAAGTPGTWTAMAALP